MFGFATPPSPEPSPSPPPEPSPHSDRQSSFAFHTRLDSSNPLLVGACTSFLIISGYKTWHRFGRRIRNVDDLRPSDFAPRRIRGVVTSVGDADNFRLFHRPLLRRSTVPTSRSELKGETLHVRLAGVDAPELAHFGNPAQPFSSEALDLLSATVLGKNVTVELYQRDRYNRVVGMAYTRPFPWLRRRNVSEVMLRAGLATVYREAGAVHAGQLARFEELEAQAKLKKLGMWSISSEQYESPAAFKRRTGGGKSGK
ncbi:hypothetical protein JCM1840_004479 [Sporobolomyces johnsonii]